jgi:hypothetical protein
MLPNSTLCLVRVDAERDTDAQTVRHGWSFNHHGTSITIVVTGERQLVRSVTHQHEVW